MVSWKMVYESLVILLLVTYGIVLLSASEKHPLLTPDVLDAIDWGVIAFFAVEYIVRFWRAGDKLRFVRSNWFDLIAMLPISSSFRFARLIRIVRLIRIMRSSPLVWTIVSSKQTRIMTAFAAVFMVWSSAGIFLLESRVNPNIQNFGDAFWWSIVTTTTVGYGDVSPVSVGGRIIAVFLMLTGIGLIGTFTASLANHWMEYFSKGGAQAGMPEKSGDKAPAVSGIAPERGEEEPPEAPRTVQDDLKRQICGWIERVDRLTEEEYALMQQSIAMLRGEKK
ncbi:ion transporter [Paenibacillus sp. MBLB4367]|uniref:ion transporter n=1 Tax=Paenibacillus sp. MBLB4367 TaxID=3384767 RepID=UPI003907FD8F